MNFQYLRLLHHVDIRVGRDGASRYRAIAIIWLLVLSVSPKFVPAAHDPGSTAQLPDTAATGVGRRPDAPNPPSIDPSLVPDEFTILYQFTRLNRGNAVADARELPIRLAKLSYEGRFGFTKQHRKNHSGPLPSGAILDRAAMKIIEEGAKIPARYTILDIELWKTARHINAAQAQRNSGKYLRVVREMRRRLPDRRFGYYGLPVYRHYRESLKHPSGAEFKAWQRRNDLLQPLADELDIFCPSLYTFNRDAVEEWEAYARAHVSEARRLARNGQEVLPFIWPMYHNRSKYGGEEISYEFWLAQLTTLAEIADGVFIWSNHEREDFAQTGWWRATRDFIAALERAGVRVNTWDDDVRTLPAAYP